MFLDVFWCCNLCTKSFWKPEVPQKMSRFVSSFHVLVAVASSHTLFWVQFSQQGCWPGSTMHLAPMVLIYCSTMTACAKYFSGQVVFSFQTERELQSWHQYTININMSVIVLWVFLLSIAHMILAFAWSRVHVCCLEAAFAFRLAQSHYWPKWVSYSFSRGALAFGCFKCLFGGPFFLTVSLTQYVGAMSCCTSGHNLHTLQCALTRLAPLPACLMWDLPTSMCLRLLNQSLYPGSIFRG